MPESLYPFGHGLSYTTFTYENLQISQPKVAAGEGVTISLDVSNSGSRAGDEVVQLYVRQAEGSRSAMKLKGFKRLSLQPGEQKTVTFHLHTNQLGLYDDAMRYVVQPQTVEVMIGRSAKDLSLVGKFEIIGQPIDATNDKMFFSEIEME